MSDEVDDLARAAIRRLRTGVVPSWELSSLSVGYDRVKREVEESLSKLKQHEHCTPLFVRGEWGTGKSHFLSYVRTTAAENWCASARVDLNARSMALSHPQRFLPLIADSIFAGDHFGIQDLVLRLMNIDELRRRMNAFSETPEAGDIGWAVRTLCHEFESYGGLGLSNHDAWTVLRGADLSWSDDASKKEKALSRIEALAGLCRAVGLKGLILILDEAETIDQLWNIRSRLSGYSVLGRLAEIKSLWCVLGITLRFDRTIRSDLSNRVLANETITAGARRFLQKWNRVEFGIIEPPAITRQRADELARSVTSLYERAYPEVDNDGAVVTERCVDEWMRNPVRNPRRLIRLLVHRLDVGRGLGGFAAPMDR